MIKGGGMSTREKAKIKDMEETQKRVLQTQLRIDTQLQNIRIDEFRNRMTETEKQIHDIKEKMDTFSITEFEKNIRKNTAMCEAFESKIKTNKDNADERMEALSDRDRELKREIEQLQKGLEEFKNE